MVDEFNLTNIYCVCDLMEMASTMNTYFRKLVFNNAKFSGLI